MPVNPATLHSIANPLEGLTDVAQIYVQGKKRQRDEARVNEQWSEEKKMNLLKRQLMEAQLDKSQQDSLYDESRTMDAVTNQIMEELNANPDVAKNPESYNQLIQSITSGLPDSIGKKLAGVPVDKISKINRRSKRLVMALDDSAEAKPNYERIQLQNKKTKELDLYRKDDPRVDDITGPNGTHVKYYPGDKGSSADVGATKKTMSDLQSDSLKAAQMQDQIASLDKLFKTGGDDKLTYQSKAGDIMLSFGEKLGVELPTDMKDSIKDRTKMQDVASQLYTNWRLSVTGSQAGKYELAEIKAQPPNMDDSKTEFQTKLTQWKDLSDRIQVRSLKAQSQGFSPSGVVDINGKEVPTWTNNETGEVKSISDFGALGQIPTMKQYMAKELQKEYPNVDDMSDEEVKKAIRKVTSQAQSLGYR